MPSTSKLYIVEVGKEMLVAYRSVRSVAEIGVDLLQPGAQRGGGR
jgi:hypothetical protein